MESKKRYTREEKIKHYQRKILNLEYALQRATERLHFIMSDNYQDWTSDLETDLRNTKARKKRA